MNQFNWESISERVDLGGLLQRLNARMKGLSEVLSGLRRSGNLFLLDEPLVSTGRRIAVASKTAAYTATNEDELLRVDATGGAVTVTLPPAADHAGLRLTVKKIDSSVNAVTVDGNGSETLDGAATKSLAAQYDHLTVVSNGTGWDIIG